MHPELAAALSRLDAARSTLRAAMEAVPLSLRPQKPGADRWSANEVVEHVHKAEAVFLTSLLAALDAARTTGLPAEVDQPELLPDQTKAFLLDRTNRRSAPETVQPTGTVDAATSFEQIEAGHLRLRDVLTSCEGLALSTVTHEHRFFGKLNVYQWVDLIAGHEGRHTAQLREIAKQVMSPA
jgi:hypothetical protein